MRMAEKINILEGARIAIALTGSFCTLEKVFEAVRLLKEAGARLTPILSPAVATIDTRFFRAAESRGIIESICRNKALTEIAQVEPIGPKKHFDLLVIAPCTGNTCAKLACGIADTSVTMACKSQLRNERPVLIALSTNDALAVAAQNVGTLMSRKHIYFVPIGQDDPIDKPASMVFDTKKLVQSCEAALERRQIQPVVFGYL